MQANRVSHFLSLVQQVGLQNKLFAKKKWFWLFILVNTTVMKCFDCLTMSSFDMDYNVLMAYLSSSRSEVDFLHVTLLSTICSAVIGWFLTAVIGAFQSISWYEKTEVFKEKAD